MMDSRDLTNEPTGDLTSLLGSRICHDLISPLGAIGNGVELLTMSGAAASPEMSLILQSVNSASARIRFFRVAFGAAGQDQTIGSAEVMSIIDDVGRGSRIKTSWQGPPDVPRGAVKMAFLGILCMETALPWGGTIHVAASGSGWTIESEAERIRSDPNVWSRLSERPANTPLVANNVQFALLPEEARRQGRTVRLVIRDKSITIRF